VNAPSSGNEPPDDDAEVEREKIIAFVRRRSHPIPDEDTRASRLQFGADVRAAEALLAWGCRAGTGLQRHLGSAEVGALV